MTAMLSLNPSSQLSNQPVACLPSAPSLLTAFEMYACNVKLTAPTSHSIQIRRLDLLSVSLFPLPLPLSQCSTPTTSPLNVLPFHIHGLAVSAIPFCSM